MVYICKGCCECGLNCIVDGIHVIGYKKAMVNLKPSIAYMVANRCSICSDVNSSIWYLKNILKCPCCGTKLKRKSKHSYGRAKVTKFLSRTQFFKNQTAYINTNR